MSKIFALEGEWGTSPNDKTGIRSMLQLLKDVNGIDFFHRRVATKSDFEFYLRKSKGKRFSIIYLAFHGSKDCIYLGNDKHVLSLEEIAEVANGCLENKIVHFGSCQTCKSVSSLSDFKESTTAKFVSGYKKDIDWIDSTILDLAYFSNLDELTRKGAIENRMSSKYADLHERLGFVVFR